MGAFSADFRTLSMVNLTAAIAHSLATWARLKRNKFRLRTYTRSFVSISWIIGIGSLIYMLYRNFGLRAYAGNSVIMKLLKGWAVRGSSGLAYLIPMIVASTYFAAENMDKVVQAVVTDVTTDLAAAVATVDPTTAQTIATAAGGTPVA
eukprot:jgi/Mesvir1/25158/Mv18838-RA.1